MCILLQCTKSLCKSLIKLWTTTNYLGSRNSAVCPKNINNWCFYCHFLSHTCKCIPYNKNLATIQISFHYISLLQSESVHKETEVFDKHDMYEYLYSKRFSLPFCIPWIFVEYQFRCLCDIHLSYFVLSLKQWLLLKRTFKSLLVNPRHVHSFGFFLYFVLHI